MFAKVKSEGLLGIESYDVEVEADLSSGMPRFDLVGLPDAAVKESRERVRASIKNCGFDFPVSRITVNIAPADIKKAGARIRPAYTRFNTESKRSNQGKFG